MYQKVLVLYFGSQYTQLIARRIREAEVYCEIVPFNKIPALDESFKGIVLSGSPCSVNEENAPDIDVLSLVAKVPILGICYGAQLIAKKFGGKVEKCEKREYGRAHLHIKDEQDALLAGIDDGSQIWMSHGDSIMELGGDFHITAISDSIPVAAFCSNSNTFPNPIHAIQFHPEVYHSTQGFDIIKNFLHTICGIDSQWTPANFVQETVADLQQKIGNEKVILGLSGGVDSSVAALLLQKAIGNNLICICVYNGLLRKYEYHSFL